MNKIRKAFGSLFRFFLIEYINDASKSWFGGKSDD